MQCIPIGHYVLLHNQHAEYINEFNYWQLILFDQDWGNHIIFQVNRHRIE
jgi:hypothetical protein